jgi:hypothetical protein
MLAATKAKTEMSAALPTCDLQRVRKRVTRLRWEINPEGHLALARIALVLKHFLLHRKNTT